MADASIPLKAKVKAKKKKQKKIWFTDVIIQVDVK